MSANNGGPAFPRDHAHDGHNGMTLRDYFAAAADFSQLNVSDMEAAEKLVGRPVPEDTIEQAGWQFELVAKLRYMAADAMLRARGEA